MSVALSIVNGKIADETALCIEETRNSKFLGGFFYPRRKAEPECKAKANAKYAEDLAAAQQEAIGRDQQEYDIYSGQLTGGMSKSTIGVIGGVLVLLLVAIVLID